MTHSARAAKPSRGLTTKVRLALWIGAAALLLVPAIAMLLTGEVNWGPEDFIVMGVLLAALCAAVEVAHAFAQTRAARFVAIAISVLVFLAIWAELAVGIFD